MVIHRLTNQTVGSETYLQKTTYRGKKWREIIIRTKCWRKSWAVQRGAQGKAWAVLDLRSQNGHLGILFICPEIPDGLKLKEKYLHTYPKDGCAEIQRWWLPISHAAFTAWTGYKGCIWDDENDIKPHAEVRKMVLDVILNSITRMEHQCLHMVHAEDRCGALCWWTMRWQHEGIQVGGGSGQHTGVLRIHVLHDHGICTYSALIVKSGFFRHVVVRWQGWWYSDRLPLESEGGRNRDHPDLSGCI